MKPHEFAGTIPGMGISRVALLPQFAAPPAPRPVDAHNVTLRLATSADEPFLWEMLAEAARLEGRYTDEDLERVIRAKGIDELGAQATDPVSGSGTP